MTLPSELLLPGRVVTRAHGFSLIPSECLALGARGVVVHGRAFHENRCEWDAAAAGGPGRFELYAYAGNEPALPDVEALIAFARGCGAEFICGIGGGSILDLAKVAAGLLNASKPPAYYQEGGTLTERGVPFIAAPTTAGSGAEATPNGVIINPVRRQKLSIRDNRFMARTVILDSRLLASAPAAVLRDSGLDAFVQAYESFISKNAKEFTDALALRAVRLIYTSLAAAVQTRSSEALSNLLEGSFLAGMALANARLGVIHGLAHPLGLFYGLPHGAVCAACLPASIKMNREAMGLKYRALSDAVQGDFAEKVNDLFRALGFESPFKGKPLLEREAVIAETLKSGSTAANPLTITRGHVETLLSDIFAAND